MKKCKIKAHIIVLVFWYNVCFSIGHLIQCLKHLFEIGFHFAKLFFNVIIYFAVYNQLRPSWVTKCIIWASNFPFVCINGVLINIVKPSVIGKPFNKITGNPMMIWIIIHI